MALYDDPAATLDDLRDAVTIYEETDRIARRVFGSAHPMVVGIEQELRKSRAALRARESRCPSGALVLAVTIAVVAAIDRGCRLGFWRGYY